MIGLNIWGSGRLVIPIDMGRSSRHGLALWSATSRRATTARRVADLSLSSLGPRLTPGRRVTVRWPEILGEAEWREIGQHIASFLASFEHVVSYQPPQETRAGMALLLVGSGKPLAFVKIRQREDPNLVRETDVLEVLAGGTRDVWTPRVLGTGTTRTWRYVVTDPLPSARHMPCFRLPDNGLVDWYQESIKSVLEIGPQGLVPMHGDFAPWNVRRLPDGRIAIIDWEDAGWGPSGADLAYLSAAGRAMRRRAAESRTHSSEAAAFWRQHLERSDPSGRRDQILRDRMLSALTDE